MKMPGVKDLPLRNELPDVFIFEDGARVTSLAEWNKRKEEIAELYQYYMYGYMPDKSGESIRMEYIDSCKIGSWSGEEIRRAGPAQKILRLKIKNGNRESSFALAISFPEDREGQIAPPQHPGGYPVLIVIGPLGQAQRKYLNEFGYVVIEFSNNEVAADNRSRTGTFYDLYPYGERPEEQAGTLMAWAWGVSKIIDLVEMDTAGPNELGISPENIIVAGVSRCGKATAVAGAFDKRIKVVVPASSGAGGIASFRYISTGRIYDYSGLKKEEFIDFLGEEEGTLNWQCLQDNPYHLVTDNEPLSNLQSYGAHWFNDTFLEFEKVDQLPFDQHFLPVLAADPDRYYFITGEVVEGDWMNPAGTYLSFLAARRIYAGLSSSDNIAIHLQALGHALTLENIKYLVEFCEEKLFGISHGIKDLNDLKISIFEAPENYDSYFDTVKKMPVPDLK
ncbi:MAG: hypothetical protein WBK53_08680 [Halanaerobiales bacterium]